MWQVAFSHEYMMQNVTAHAAMYSQLKLRALAKMNYLPSWWYLRDMACDVMKRQGWNVDDSEMQQLWQGTVEWCRTVGLKMGIQDDSGTGVKQHGEYAGQESVAKVES